MSQSLSESSPSPQVSFEAQVVEQLASRPPPEGVELLKLSLKPDRAKELAIVGHAFVRHWGRRKAFARDRSFSGDAATVTRGPPSHTSTPTTTDATLVTAPRILISLSSLARRRWWDCSAAR